MSSYPISNATQQTKNTNTQYRSGKRRTKSDGDICQGTFVPKDEYHLSIKLNLTSKKLEGFNSSYQDKSGIYLYEWNNPLRAKKAKMEISNARRKDNIQKLPLPPLKKPGISEDI